MAIYNARRRDFQSHSTFMHHVAWGIVCIMLATVLMGIWTNLQTLQRENYLLKNQLANAKTVQTTCKVKGSWPANTTKQLSLATPSGSRDYLVHLPSSFSSDHYYPVLMFYPGKGATAAGAEQAYGLDKLPAIVVYPFPSIGTDGATAWEGAPYSSTADDVSFTANILDKLQADLCIDRTKIYAAGMSNGGGFASVLSCELPDRFAAYAVVAGAMYYPHGECKPPVPAPLISIHSDSDDIVPFTGSVIRRLPPIYDWTTMRASMNGCKTKQESQSGVTISTTLWTDCTNNSLVKNVQIHGGGHMWGQMSNDFLWQFLSQFSK
ncbi:MAG: PHB depolymerase family esterase [Candidatus Saccharimonadales bacterium]